MDSNVLFMQFLSWSISFQPFDLFSNTEVLVGRMLTVSVNYPGGPTGQLLNYSPLSSHSLCFVMSGTCPLQSIESKANNTEENAPTLQYSNHQGKK